VQLLDPGLQLLHPLRQPVALAQGTGELGLQRGEMRVHLVAVVTTECDVERNRLGRVGHGWIPPGTKTALDLGILAGSQNRHQDTE
jgi:hypothetical protein